MTQSERTDLINEAAGIDIDILEDAWAAALADEDFEDAGRLQGLIHAARAAAGLDPRTSR